jgi:hypothetical protein
MMVNKWSLAGDNSKYKLPDAAPAGFWAGFWHGLIAPTAFWIGFFKPGVRIYETRNNGHWYDLGFVWGLAASMGRRSLVIKIDNQKRISLTADEA